MRPVEKPASHPGYTNGQPYGNAQRPLASAIGEFCSYCERTLPYKLEVEHKKPKSIHKALKTTWANFLLSCGNCNPPKSNRNEIYIKDEKGVVWQETVSGTYPMWPDELHDDEDYIRDTFNLVEYKANGRLSPNPKIPYAQDTDRIIATMAMVNLGHILNEGFDIGNIWFGKVLKGAQHYESGKSAMGFELSGKPPQSPRFMHQIVQPIAMALSAHVSKTVPDSLMQRAEEGIAGPDVKDYRVRDRTKAWEMAHEARAHFDAMVMGNFTDASLNWGGLKAHAYQTMNKKQIRRVMIEARNNVRKLAMSKGFWSVWVTAFKGGDPLPGFKNRNPVVPVLKTLLRKRYFPGTRANTEFRPLIYDESDEQWRDAVMNGRPDAFFELESLQKQYDILESNVEDLEAEAEESDQTIKKLRTERSGLKADVSDLRNQLQQSKVANQKLLQERNNLFGQRDQAIHERDNLQSQVDDLNRRLSNCFNTQKQLRGARDQARLQRDKAWREIERLSNPFQQ